MDKVFKALAVPSRRQLLDWLHADDPPRKLVLTWRNQFQPELHAEGFSRMTYELEKHGESVKLTVIHEMDRPGSQFIDKVSSGWPHILSSLKSLLETGESLEEARHWPKGM